MDSSKLYDIYLVGLRWSHDYIPGDYEYGPAWFEGLGPGRIWANHSFDKMPKEQSESVVADLTAEATEFWGKWEKRGDNPADLQVTVKFLRKESWCQGWFCHWTWDVGLDNADVNASFHNFVRRMQEMNRREGKRVDGHWREPYILMGAEDYWRWHGRAGRGGYEDEQTNSPCRCDACKEQGIVRICH